MLGEDVVKKQSKFLPSHVKETALKALDLRGLRIHFSAICFNKLKAIYYLPYWDENVF